MENYKDLLRSFDKEQLLNYISISPLMAEEYESALIGAIHNTDVNGVDATTKCGRPVEIKTQCYTGNYKLRGRGKYGCATQAIYDKKLENNEHTVVVGYEAHTGNIYYRFSFDFNAIADRYWASVKDRLDRGLGSQNYDTYPHHYIHHESFKVEYVADPLTLYLNQHVFTKNFYNFLLGYSITKTIDRDYHPQGNSEKNILSERWNMSAKIAYYQTRNIEDVKKYFDNLEEQFQTTDTQKLKQEN